MPENPNNSADGSDVPAVLPPERDESPNIETDEVAISELDFDEQVELSISQLDSIMEGENIAEPIQPLANNANKPDDQKDTLIPPASNIHPATTPETTPAAPKQEVIAVSPPHDPLNADIPVAVSLGDAQDHLPHDLADLSLIAPNTHLLSGIPDFYSLTITTFEEVAGPKPPLPPNGAMQDAGEKETMLPPPNWNPEEIMEAAPDSETQAVEEPTRTYDPKLLRIPDFLKTDYYHVYERALAQHQKNVQAYCEDPQNSPKPSKPPSFWDAFEIYLAATGYYK